MWSPLPQERTYTIKSRATDNGGHVEIPGSVSITIDNVAPSSAITAPVDGATLTDSLYVITGTAADDPGSGVEKVEVGITPSGGTTTWYTATGTTDWSYTWHVPVTKGEYTIQSRAMDRAGNVEAPESGVTVTYSADASLCAWGGNHWGQLGDGTTTWYESPIPISGLSGVKTIAGGYGHTIALKSDGTVWTWGDNYYGELGGCTTVYRYTPALVSGLSGVVTIAGMGQHSMAMKSDGTVWVWGDNRYGQSGGSGTVIRLNSPVQMSGLNGITAIACGGWHSIALKSDGTVWTWGENNDGQLGNGTSDGVYSSASHPNPIQVNGLSGIAAIGGGAVHTIALKSDGTVWAWGSNYDGQIGDGTYSERDNPVQVNGLQEKITAISAGCYQNIAIASDATIWGWGNNCEGELGDGTNISKNRALQIKNINEVATVATGYFATLAVRYVITSNITYPACGSINGTNRTITGTVLDTNHGIQEIEVGITPIGGSTTWYKPADGVIDTSGNGTWATWSYSWTLPAEGTYTIQSRATDNLSIQETPGKGVTITVDNTAPTSAITNQSDGSILHSPTSISIAGTATDGTGSGVGGIQVGITPSRGATTWYTASGTASWSYSWTPTSDGSYTIQSRATDNANNVETPGAGVTVTVQNNSIILGYTQNGASVTLSAKMYYNGAAASGKTIAFHELTGTTTASKGTATTKGGIATLKFNSSLGAHAAYAKFTVSGGIPAITSNNVAYDIEKATGLAASPSASSSATGDIVTSATPALSWNSFNNATQYHVQMSTSAAFTPGTHTHDYISPGASPASISWPWSTFSLIKGTTYYWRAQAILTNDSMSTWSAYRTVVYKNATVTTSVPVVTTYISGSTTTTRVTVTASLTDASTNPPSPLGGKTLMFYDQTLGASGWSVPVLKGSAATATKTSATTTLGTAVYRWTITGTLAPGSHRASVKFGGGGASYAPSSSSALIYP